MTNQRQTAHEPRDDYETITVTALSPALGADVDAGDLRHIDDIQFKEIRRAWLAHHVIRVRNQQFQNADMVAFGSRFGAFQPNLVQAGRDPAYPQVSFISNLVANNQALGMLGDGELVWHTDQSSFEITPSATILYAVEAPRGQGYTEFLNMQLAFETLSPALRLRAESLQLKHDDTYDSAGQRRPGYANVDDVRTSPGAVHPFVITHPETGRKALFLGRRPNAYVVGLSVDASEALLDEVWAHAMQPQFTWRQEWLPGDMLVWDNRSVMHRRTPFDSHARRMLRRVVIQGSRPRFDAACAGGLQPGRE